MSISNVLGNNGKIVASVLPNPYPFPATPAGLGQVLAVNNSALTPTGPPVPQNITDVGTLGASNIQAPFGSILALNSDLIQNGVTANLGILPAGNITIKGAQTKGSMLVGNGTSTAELVVPSGPPLPNGSVLILDDTTALGVRWGGESGDINSITPGNNIDILGTSANPIVALRAPLTSTLGMGSVALTDKIGASGTAGQFLSAGAGGETLWASIPSPSVPTIDAVLGAGDTAINKDMNLQISGVNNSQINFNPVGQNATISVYTDNGGGSNQKYINLITPIASQGSLYPRPTIRAGTSAGNEGLNFDIDNVVSATIDNIGIIGTSTGNQITRLDTQSNPPKLRFANTLAAPTQTSSYDKSGISFQDTSVPPLAVLGQYSAGGFSNTSQNGTGDITTCLHSQGLGTDYITQTNLQSGIQTQINNEVSFSNAIDKVSYSVPSTSFETKITSTADAGTAIMEVKWDDTLTNYLSSTTTSTANSVGCQLTGVSEQFIGSGINQLGTFAGSSTVSQGELIATWQNLTPSSLVSATSGLISNGGASAMTLTNANISGGQSQLLRMECPSSSNALIEHISLGFSPVRDLNITTPGKFFVQAGANGFDIRSPAGATQTAIVGNAVGTLIGSGVNHIMRTTGNSSAASASYLFQNENTSTASYPAIKIDRPAATSVAGDTIATISTWADNYTGASREYARITSIAQNVGSVATPSNVDGTLQFQTLVNDSFNTFLTMNGSTQDVDIGKRLDMNNNNIATTSGDLTLDASVSSGTGNINLTCKAAGTLNITATTATATTAHNVSFTANTNGIQSGNYLKLKLGGVDIWVPYLTTDPTL